MKNLLVTVLDSIKLMKISEIVMCDDIKTLQKQLNAETLNKYNITVETDARSAAFFAYGLSKRIGRPVILIVNDTYLANCFTAIVEAWFQKVSLIIIDINVQNNINAEYLYGYLEGKYEITDKSLDEQDMLKLSTNRGPVLITLPLPYEELYMNNNAHALDIAQLLFGSQENAHIFYTGDIRPILPNCYFHIEPRYKYGILSKYLGYLESGKKAILVMDEEYLKYELNAFTSRYINKRFILILYGEAKGIMDNVLRLNSSVKVLKAMDEDYKTIIKQENSPIILLTE